MQFHEIPTVLVDTAKVYKFIICSIRDPHSGANRLIIRADKSCEYHVDIFAKHVRYELADFQPRCIGGGRISIDRNARTIAIWGSSGSYGREPDRNVTCAMLAEAFPGFRVIQR